MAEAHISLSNQQAKVFPSEVQGISWGKLRMERFRLATFKNYPARCGKSPIVLARDGFVYVGQGRGTDDDVMCYFCHAVKGGWRYFDDTNTIHKELSPGCPMVTGQFCDNVQMVCNNVNTHAGETTINVLQVQWELTLLNSRNISGETFSTQNVNNNTVQSVSDNYLTLNERNTQTDIQQNGSSVTSSFSILPSSTNLTAVPTVSLPTTLPQTVQTQTVASNSNQVATATPQESATNLSSSQTGNTTELQPANQNSRRNGRNPTYAELGIITERPKRLDYALKVKRLESLSAWPSRHHLVKEDLAEAGFYYGGYGDCARCFYCGGGLRNWEDEDDVWVEHARWFPTCAYIRQTMGQVFIDAVQTLNKVFDQISFQMVTEKIRTEFPAYRHSSNDSCLSRDAAVRTLVEMGYKLEEVEEAARVVKQEAGQISADDILEKLRKDGKQREKNSNPASRQCEYTVQMDPLTYQESLSRIKERNNQLRQQTVCKICMDREVAVVFLPCGHLVSCSDCAAAMKDCPVCRKVVKGIVRAFIG